VTAAVARGVDIEGAVRAYLTAYEGLVGSGCPLNGVHIGHARAQAVGAVTELKVAGPRRLDDITDDARIQTLTRATGRAAREVADAGARALLEAVLALSGAHVLVTTRRGQTVRLLAAGDSDGPTLAGENGSEVVFGVDFTVRAYPED
jgi:hypothetical protein